jgi:hypothetical protein
MPSSFSSRVGPGFWHDDLGQLVVDGRGLYSYTPAGLLETAQMGSGLAVTDRYDADAWRAAIAAGKMAWRHSLDGSGRVAKAFSVWPIPTTVVIDGEGIIRGRLVGFFDSFGFELEDAVRDGLKRLSAAGK